MIKALTVTNYVGDSITIDLRNPEETGFAITEITGIGPGKATINISDLATSDGGLYNSSRLSYRSIGIGMRFVWPSGNETIEEVRQKTYKYFPIKRLVTLVFETDIRSVKIQGRVEENEPNIFSDESGCDITIVCPNPYFQSADGDGVQVTNFASIDPCFEFPFCNDSLTEDLLIMGDIVLIKENTIVYEGEAETGVTITLHCIGEVSNITIYNITNGGVLTIDTDKVASLTGSGLVYGDDIVICTEVGSKSISLLREGITYNLLNCINKDSSWLTLEKGDNIISFTAEDGSEYMQLSIENKILYEGV